MDFADEGVLEEPIQHRAETAGVVRLLPGLLQLPEDLCFTQHQGVQPAGHADQVARRVLALVGVEMLIQLAGRDAVGAVHPIEQLFLARPRGQAVDLRAIAGAQDQHFLDAGERAQLLDPGGILRAGYCDPLPDLDGGRVVTDSDRKKRHGQKVSRCALILRVRGLFIKPHPGVLAIGFRRDWFGGGKRVSFVPMRTNPLFSRLTSPAPWLACFLAACLLAACAAAPERGADQAAKQDEAAVSAPETAPDAGTRRQPTDDEVMYRVFAAEYLGAEGDLPAAVGEYLEAAMLSDDPEIARRASRVAFAAQSWQQAAMAADRWAVLDPQNVAAHESAAVAMLNVNDYVGAEFHVMQILT
jgi:hypothetical protein